MSSDREDRPRSSGFTDNNRGGGRHEPPSAPGKRAHTDTLGGRRPTRQDIERTVQQAEEAVEAAHVERERLAAAIDARDLATARSSGNALDVALLSAAEQLRAAKADLGELRPAAAPSLSPANWLAAPEDSGDLVGRIATVEVKLGAEQVQAAPLLAMRPANYRDEADEWQAAMLADPLAMARLDAADDRARAEWTDALDAREGEGSAEADAAAKRPAASRLDLRRPPRRVRRTANVDDGVTSEKARATKDADATPHGQSARRLPASIDAPATYEESRATIDDQAKLPAGTLRHVTTAPHVANPHGAPVTIDAPAMYEETRGTIDDHVDRSAPKRGHVTAAPRIANPHGAPVTIDAPPMYEETRGTIDDHVSATPRIANPHGAPMTIDAPATYDETRATIDDHAGRPLPDGMRGELEAATGSSLAHVRVHRGRRGDATAAAHGARAVAIGNDISIRDGEPEVETPAGRELLAHEVAHVRQAEAGGGASPRAKGGSDATSSVEVEADAFAADFAVRGGAARWQPTFSASGALTKRPDAQGELVRADDYYSAHGDKFHEVIRTQLAAALPEPGSGIRWKATPEEVADAVLRGMRFAAGSGLLTQNLPTLLHPHDPWKLIDDHRTVSPTPDAPHPVGPRAWEPAAGHAIAVAVESALRASLPRMSARFVAQAEQSYGGKVTLDALVASHPFDRVTALLLTTYDLVAYQGATLEKPGKRRSAPSEDGRATFRDGLRMVADYQWLGAEDPALWNWVRVRDIPDATPEEVAMAIFDNLAGETETHLAYGITSAPPLFGVPAEWARRIPGAAKHAPPEDKESTAPDALAIAGSDFADEAALAQADAAPHRANARGKAAPSAAAMVATIEKGLIQIDLVWQSLLPWDVAGLVLPAKHWLVRQQDTLAAATPKDVERWTPVLDGQQSILFEASGAVVELLEMAGASGARRAADPQAAPFVEAISVFATAIGESHLVNTAQEQLAKARRLRAMLPLTLLGGAVRESGRAVNDLTANESATNAEAAAARGEQTYLSEESLRMQEQAMRGEAIDPEQMDAIALRAAEHSFRTRLTDLRRKSELLSGLIESSNVSAGQMIGNALAGNLHEVDLELQQLTLGVDTIVIDMDLEADAAALTIENGPERARSLRAVRRRALTGAQAAFAALAQRTHLDTLFPRVIDEVEDAQMRGLIIDIALLIGVSVASAGAATYVAGVVRGSMMGNAAAGTAHFLANARRASVASTAVGFGTEAALNAAGQAVIQGGSFGDTFLDNLATDAAVLAALRPFHALTASWGELDATALRTWERVGRKGALVVARGVVVTGEMITAAGVAYVVQQIRHGAPPPDEHTMLEWVVQGASMALGRFVAGRASQMMERLEAAGEEAGALVRRARQQKQRAARLESAGDPQLALELLAEEHALLTDEAALFQRLADDPDLRARAGFKSEGQVERLARGNATARADVATSAFQELPLRLGGLEEVVPGALWRGTSEEIATALHQAAKAGVEVTVLNHDETSRRWEIQAGERRLLIEEKERDGRPREPRKDVTPESAKQAKRYAEAARFLQERYEAHIKATIESRAVVEVDHLQVGNSIAGVINQATLPAVAGFEQRLVVYRDRGTLGDRGETPIGQAPELIDAPGMRVSEQTADRGRFAKASELGDALDVGRFENQVPAYQAEVIGLEQRPPRLPDDWAAPGKTMRVRVRADGTERWIYTDHVDYAGGLGPTNWKPLEPFCAADDFATLRKEGLLLAGDDGRLGAKLKAGAERILVLGGSPSGAWAAEDAVRMGADSVDLMGDVRPQQRAQILAKLQAANGDPAKVEEIMADYERAAHSGRQLRRNRDPGAAYANPAVKIEVGTPSRMVPTADRRVRVTMGEGDTAEVRVYDQVVAAYGQDAAAAGGPRAILGDPDDGSRIELRPVIEKGVLVALESIDPPGIRLVGSAYTRPELMPWVAADYQRQFADGLRALAGNDHVRQDGRAVSDDSKGVQGGIEAQADALPLANEALVKRHFRLESRGRRLALNGDPATWDDQVAEHLADHLRDRVDRVRVRRRSEEDDDLVVFDVWIADVMVGTAAVSRTKRRIELEANDD